MKYKAMNRSKEFVTKVTRAWKYRMWLYMCQKTIIKVKFHRTCRTFVPRFTISNNIIFNLCQGSANSSKMSHLRHGHTGTDSRIKMKTVRWTLAFDGSTIWQFWFVLADRRLRPVGSSYSKSSVRVDTRDRFFGNESREFEFDSGWGSPSLSNFFFKDYLWSRLYSGPPVCGSKVFRFGPGNPDL